MADLEHLQRRLSDRKAILEKVADEVVLPALARNYPASGLKQRSGRLFRGITQRGADGNYITATNDSLTVGVSYEKIQYARWALGGRGPVVAKRAKALRFVIDGRVIFRKRVGPAPAHRVYYLEGEDVQKAYTVIRRMIETGE